MDLEYSRGHWLVRGEAIWSQWDVPLAATGARLPVSARGVSVEGRYRFIPRMFIAARADDLAFSRITGAAGGISTPWDAAVTRIELGGGYYLQRNLVARAAVQHNRRDAGFVRRRTFVSAQLAYWF
jgi:predicted porin